MKTHYEVVAAVIVRQTADKPKEFFCAQRAGPSPSRKASETDYKWEFPGGKIEPGETQQEALKREIKEEFDTDIHVDLFITTVTHEYRNFTITMHAYYCTVLHGLLKCKEHLDAAWLEPKYLLKKEWADADIPIMNLVVKQNSDRLPRSASE